MYNNLFDNSYEYDDHHNIPGWLIKNQLIGLCSSIR